MTDFDTAMSILENRLRRRILERLVREPHYPLQLAELLDSSQQAVMKHLKVLSEAGFVTSEKVPSEKGGPPRRIYAVTESFSLRLDLGPDLFRCEQRHLPRGGPVRLSQRLPENALTIAENIGTRRRLPMSEAVDMLADLNNQLDALDANRDALIALHQQIMQKVSRAVEDEFDAYEERQLMHAILEAPRRPLDLDQFCKAMQIQTVQAEAMMDSLRDVMLREVGRAGGSLIAAKEGTPLPWWLMRD